MFATLASAFVVLWLGSLRGEAGLFAFCLLSNGEAAEIFSNCVMHYRSIMLLTDVRIPEELRLSDGTRQMRYAEILAGELVTSKEAKRAGLEENVNFTRSWDEDKRRIAQLSAGMQKF